MSPKRRGREISFEQNERRDKDEARPQKRIEDRMNRTEDRHQAENYWGKNPHIVLNLWANKSARCTAAGL